MDLYSGTGSQAILMANIACFNAALNNAGNKVGVIAGKGLTIVVQRDIIKTTSLAGLFIKVRMERRGQMGLMKKTKWNKAKLIVLVRQEPAEMVLVGCKRSDRSGASSRNNNCQTWRVDSCSSDCSGWSGS
jgi:hypothetical protein